MTRVLIVRHGQSEWNALGRWQGQENPPLTDLGREQARLAARAVGAVEGIHASPLGRAAATAAIISAELGVGPVIVDQGLMERNAGEWQGMTRGEIEEQFPGYLDDGRRPEGWEDDGEVTRRVLAALDRVHQAHPYGEALVVSHAGAIFAIETALGASWEALPNLGGRFLERQGDRWRLGPRVHLLTNETYPNQI